MQIIGCLQSLELCGMTVADLGYPVPMMTPSAALPSLAAAARVLTW